MNDWYPSQDAKLSAFLTNFVANVGTATAELNLSANAFAAATAAAQNWLVCYTARQEAQKTLDTALAALQKQAPDTQKNLRAAAKQIKSTMNVPASILALLELTSTGEASLDRVAAQAPALAATAERDTVVIKYKKMGHQGLLLYSCRTGETAFSLLGTYTLNRIEDTRPNRVPSQPELRQYYAVYMDKDQPTGSQSATVGVVIGTTMV